MRHHKRPEMKKFAKKVSPKAHHGKPHYEGNSRDWLDMVGPYRNDREDDEVKELEF